MLLLRVLALIALTAMLGYTLSWCLMLMDSPDSATRAGGVVLCFAVLLAYILGAADLYPAWPKRRRRNIH